jgi:plastocyanin
MFRSRSIAIGALVAALALAVAATALARPAKTVTLKGSVGPGFTISLTSNGKKVKKLKPGSYTFVVTDKSSIHSFTIEKEKGGKFEKAITTVPGTGKKTVTIKLTKGQWKYYCPPHESSMFGKFTVR